jgi:hypothetical protein
VLYGTCPLHMKKESWLCFVLLILVNSVHAVESLGYCPNLLQEYKVSINSKVQMLNQLVQSEEDIKRTIQHQINYLNPHFVNKSKSVTLSKVESIKLLDKKTFKAPLNFEIDNNNFESPEDAYFSQVLSLAPKKNQILEFLEVDYVAELKMVKCESLDLDLSYYLPLMPQLAYWFIEKSQRLEYEYVTGAKNIVNPCATNELADFNKPYYFWYFWNPERSTRGTLCKDVYHSDKLNHVAQLTIEKKQTSIKTTQKATHEIHNVSIIYGNLSQKFNQDDLDQINRNYLKKNKYFEMLDLNAQNLFKLLQNLDEYFQFKIVDWKKQENAIYITLKNNKTQIQFFIGSTDIHSVWGARHFDFFTQALKESDLVIYSGHAGLGENFRIPASLELAKIKAKELAFVSCYSYRYGEEDKWQQTPNVERIYYTGYDVTHTYIEILKILDRSLMQDGSKLPENLVRHEGFAFMKNIRL